jgi:hypothetical protein
MPEPMDPCPICRQPIQRTPNGTWADGLTEHAEFVHPAISAEQVELLNTVLADD